MLKRYALCDDQWACIGHLLPSQPGHVSTNGANTRLIVDAVLYRHRADIPWRNLPARSGDFRNTYQRHSRWSRTGVWRRVFEMLATQADN